MAFLELHFYADSLACDTTVNVLLPEARKGRGPYVPGSTYKTLYLLHGLSDDHTAWMRKSSIERYAAEYGIAVVMPNVNRSWYTDTAYNANYFTFLTKELPTVCRRYFKNMSEKREDNMIAGLSMGGYGAVKSALLCPEVFGACASLSGALDITRRNRVYNLEEWRSIFGFDLQSADELTDSKHDLFAIAKRNREKGVPMPDLYLWCGTEDTLITVNRDFSKHLHELDIKHQYEESEGDHSWKWWDLHIQSALRYFFNKENLPH